MVTLARIGPLASSSLSASVATVKTFVVALASTEISRAPWLPAARKSEFAASVTVTLTLVAASGAGSNVRVKLALPPSLTASLEVGAMVTSGSIRSSSSRMVNAPAPLTPMPPPRLLSDARTSASFTDTDSPLPSSRLSSVAVRVTVAAAALGPRKVTVGSSPSRA